MASSREVASRGLIPAHAGKTSISRTTARFAPAHPRSRGENPLPDETPPPPAGSSPLTRGKRVRDRCGQSMLGLIPAHAGKTRRRQARGSGGRAHPRSRGENESRDAHSSEPTGSSPLTRGKQIDGALVGLAGRLIPAHAGKTTRPTQPPSRPEAHPRSRGENLFSPPDCPSVSGSSPLTRGKRMLPSWKGPEDRLIPAHAGKTSGRGLRTNAGPAHPRSRGENLWSAGKSLIDGGSSPLTRGKRYQVVPKLGTRGLIPAHAGKTRRR